MEKIYIKFGDFTKKDEIISCFEGVIDDHIVKILMPTATYPACQFLARVVEEQAFVVTGDIVGKGKMGEPLLSNIKFKAPLTYDKNTENYVADFFVPTKRPKQNSIKLPKWFQR